MSNKAPSTKKERLEIVNKIMHEISIRDRRFFYGKTSGITSQLVLKNNKVYYHCNYHDELLFIPTYQEGRPKKWQGGGTLLALVRDFIDYVHKGGYTNHNNGYGGLYCPHWGYTEQSMNEIQAIAKELGYLL